MAFYLVSATVLDFRSVELEFSEDVETTTKAVSPGTYSVDGLIVLAAVMSATDKVVIYTRPMNAGTEYKVVVDPTLESTTANVITVNSMMFEGVGALAPFVVSGLTARSLCVGKAISLSWTNPVGTIRTRVYRRVSSWPIELTDPGTVLVYSGAVPIEELVDTGISTYQAGVLASAVSVGDTVINVSNTGSVWAPGDMVRVESVKGPSAYFTAEVQSVAGGPFTFALTLTAPVSVAVPLANSRVAKSSPLNAQTYYYYLVLSSVDGVTWDVAEESKTWGLSIDVYDGEEWINDQTPRKLLNLDETPVADGGGGGFLAKVNAVLGCWLNLMRGHMNAFALMGDVDKAPVQGLAWKNRELGFPPEGDSYDLDTYRRTVASLESIYQKKGSCDGIVLAVHALTGWDSECVEFGDIGCRRGGGLLQTWDGESSISREVGNVSMVTTSVDGTATLTDDGQAWSVGVYDSGILRGPVGDVCCVVSSTETTLTTRPPQAYVTTTNPALAGDTSLDLSTTSGLVPGITIQITDVANTGAIPIGAEIVEVYSVDSPTSVTLAQPLQAPHGEGSIVSIEKSVVRAEYIGVASAAVGDTITDSFAKFVTNQWVGYKLLDSTNVEFTIESNTATQITVTAGAPAVGNYAVAKSFILGGNWAGRLTPLRYEVANGNGTWLVELTLDVEEMFTATDPFDYLSPTMSASSGVSLYGVYSPNDVGIYITSPVPVAIGRASTGTGAVFDLDPSSPAPLANEWVGKYLCPNQNQNQLFEILSNTPTQVTVAGDITSLVIALQPYYVLEERDTRRLQQLRKRLRREFTSTDANVRVFFV